MAPSKLITEQHQKIQQPKLVTSVMSKLSGRIMTRSQTSTKTVFENKFTMKDLPKRKAHQLSPPKGKTTKRPALNDLIVNATSRNNVKGKSANAKKAGIGAPKQKEILKISTGQENVQSLVNLKPTTVSSLTTTITTTTITTKTNIISQNISKADIANIENIDPNTKVKPTKTSQVIPEKGTSEPRESEKHFDSIQKVTSSGNLCAKFRFSLDSFYDKSDDSSLYTSAVEDMSQCDDSLKIITPIKKVGEKETKKLNRTREITSPVVPEGVIDYDKENLHDPYQVSHYAMDIFNYMKSREKYFKVEDYMTRQVVISKWMRSLLVDWMVEVQENFELNHETLYLGVKITDIYLNKVVVAKEILQLVGAAALFIAAKYDERFPPLIDDFIYICENAFTREDIIKMEINVFKVIEYNLGMPLSYRFLRRFARCCKATMVTLTLARYILELSLMEYHLIFVSESKIACAALFLALRMMKVSGWTPTLEYYSGYKLHEFKSIILDLNTMLHSKPKEQLSRVRNKYSHKIFFEVAKTPLLDDKELFRETHDDNRDNKENL